MTDSPHSRGVCILIRKNVDIEILNCFPTQDGRILLCNVKFESKTLSLVCIYAPNNESQRRSFFEQIENHINMYASNISHLVIAGDFNCCLQDIDRNPPTHLGDTSRNILESMIDKLHVYDVWSKAYNNNPGVTYVDKYHKTLSRLDYIFVTKCFLQSNMCTLKEPCYKTIDHKLISTVIGVKGSNRGPGYWKFNSELIKDSVYCKNVQELINSLVIRYNQLSKKNIWEVLKVKIKEYTISYCYKHSKTQQSEIIQLQKKLDRMCTNTDSNEDEMENIKSKLDSLLEKEAKGAFIRSKAEWCDKGEKCSKFFLNLEAKRQVKNVIEKLKGHDGNVVSKDSDILNEISFFYENLFKAEKIETTRITNYLDNVLLPNKLSKHDETLSNKTINSKEIKKAVDKLKLNKSPGIDGLTPEFYKHFWNTLQTPLCDMINETYTTGHLPESSKLAVVSLIYKNGDPQLLKNYRPISLMNYDYKILAFVLAQRFQNVVNKVISNDQSAYIKDKFLGNNVRLVCDIINYCDKYEEAGVLLSLDFEKAFDTVEWDFVFECLTKFNFGTNFINF